MKNLAAVLLVASLAVFTFTIGAHADGRRGYHQKVYVVPAPGKVTIDGKLDDWDLSGQITISVADETAEMQSARFAMMYDESALYVSGVVRDPTPMMNRHDPLIDPSRAWDADACQIYLTTDASLGFPIVDKIGQVFPGTMDMYLWRFTDRKEPALACYQGMTWAPLHPDWNDKGAIPSGKFQAAYVEAADGKGYTFEYRIPWATLGATKPLKGGDLVAGLVQFDWSNASGMSTMGDGGWAYDVMERPGYPWQESGCWGKVIFADKGHLSSDLVEEGLPPAKPLPLTYEYDLPADGDTTFQIFDQDGTLQRTLLAAAPRHAGHNIEKWDGLDALGQPMKPGKYVWKGLYHDPITTKFLFSTSNSGQPPYHTDDGTGSWGGDHGNPMCACALADGMILGWGISEDAFGIIRTDLKGKKIWGSKHNASYIATDGSRIFVVGDFGFDAEQQPKVFDAKDCRPIMWGNGNLTLAPPPDTKPSNAIASAIAYGSGKIFVSWPLRNAVGMYDSASGNLLNSFDVQQPGELAVRPDGSAIVISGEKVYSLGGAAPKLLIDNHMDVSTDLPPIVEGSAHVHNGITVGPDGTIYVANSGKLQDISVFDANGVYLRTIGKPGGRPVMGRYDPSGIYEPGGIAVDKLGQLWVAETTDFPKRVSVWDAKSGAFVNEFFGSANYFGWAYMDPTHPDEIYSNNVIWKVDWKNNTCTPYSTIWRQTQPNQIYDYDTSGYSGHMRVYTLKDGSQVADGLGRFQHIIAKRDGDLFKPFAAQIILSRTGPWAFGPQYPVMADQTKYPDGKYYWFDANNDQTIQVNELSTDPTRWKSYLADMINHMATPSDVEAQSIDLVGNYDLGRYADNTKTKLAWQYQGGRIWNLATELPPLRPGDMIGLTTCLGTAGDYTGAASYFGVFQIVTLDGVYVGQVYRDQRLGGGYGPDVLNTETYLGQLVKPDGMNRYFALGGAADGRVTEVLGLDTVKRLPGGELDYTQADADKAAAAFAAYSAKLAKSRRLAIVRGLGAIDDARSVGKAITPQRGFTARAAYDATNLYIDYDVNSDSELVNGLTDPRIIFKGGNLLDIQIATDPKADPNRKEATAGDVRLLVGRQNGKTIAVMYRPKVAGFTGTPIVLKSPANQQAFDSIETVDVGLTYTKLSKGFTAQVTIPLSLLGMTIKPGQVVKMDVGYIFGDSSGTQESAREYWSNNGFAANIINDVPNESLLDVQQWGTAIAE